MATAGSPMQSPSENLSAAMDKAMDKLKKQISTALSLKTLEQPQPAVSQQQLEADIDHHRLSNEWQLVATDAEGLLDLLGSAHTDGSAAAAALVGGQYSPSEAAALAYSCLAQCAMVRWQLPAAALYVDKALVSDDGFMDALYLKAMIELCRQPPAAAAEGTPANTAGRTAAAAGAASSSSVTVSASKAASSSSLASPFSAVLTGPERVSAQLALSWLNRYRWQESRQQQQQWATLDSRKRSPYRYRLLLELILCRARLNEMLGQYGEAASQYGQVLSLSSVELRVEEALESRVLYAQLKAPRMLLYSGNRAECLRVMRSVLISTPANYSPAMLASLRHSFASLMLRAFSPADYTPALSNDSSRARPVSFTQEAFFLLALSGSHSLVSVPVTPPSLHWHPFSPISLSHGYSSHAVYLSHSPVPLPLTSSSPPRPDMSTIVSLDFSTSSGSGSRESASPLPQDERERVEREMALTLARSGEYVVMAEMYRNLLAAQLESPQLWYKLSITLMAAEQYNEAYLAITECLNRAPDYVMALLMAGKLCLNKLDKTKEAVTYASHALEVAQASTPVMPAAAVSPLQPLRALASPPKVEGGGSSSSSSGASSPTSRASAGSGPPPLPAPPTISLSSSSMNQLTLTPSLHASLLLSCQLLFGIACSKYAYSVSTFSNRKSLQRRALAVLQLAYKHSPSHHKVLFSLACLYADIREIGMSLSILKHCLQLDRGHAQSWNLLALLLSSQKKYTDAVKACEGMRGKGCEVLLLTKGRLLGEMGLFDAACACMTELVAAVFSKDEYEMREGKAGLKARRPVFKSRKPGSGSAAASAPASPSSSGSPAPQVLNIDDPTLFKADVLLLLSTLYSSQYSLTPQDAELLTDAYDCVQRCRQLAPSSLLPSIHSHLASLALLSASPSAAMHHFESALALDSAHTPSLIGLASLFSAAPPPLTANPVLSYGYLTQALQIDATDHRAWHEMGMLLVGEGRGEEAVDQLMTAAELERTAPIVSFGTVQRRV